MNIFKFSGKKPQCSKNKNHKRGMNASIYTDKTEENNATTTEKSIHYIFELNSLNKNVAKTVKYMVDKEVKDSFCDNIYLLYAWQCKQGRTHCVFVEVQSGDISFHIEVPYFKDGVIHLGIGNRIKFDEFYAFNKEEFFFAANHIRSNTAIGQYEMTKIWEALMKTFPDYTSKKITRTALFEKYFPYSFDHIVGAEYYSNQGMLYKMIDPNSPRTRGMMEIQDWLVSDYRKETESARLINSHCWSPYPETEDDFVSRVRDMFAGNRFNALMAIPHRRILIDDRESMHCGSMLFEADYREMHLFQSKTDTTYLILQIYSVYNGRPQEGGRMEGYTFERILEIPSEQYSWTDERVIAEYIQQFK